MPPRWSRVELEGKAGDIRGGGEEGVNLEEQGEQRKQGYDNRNGRRRI